MNTMRKSRKHERGQAIVEMVVGLIGISIVFLGILGFSLLGVENIKYLITARENADTEQGGIAPQYIADRNIWETKKDGDIYTIDDTATVGTPHDSNDFSGQLESNRTIAVVGNQDFANDPLVTGSQQQDLFLDASFLQGSRGNDLNLTEGTLSTLGLLEIFSSFFGIDDIDFDQHGHNEVFMPVGLRNDPANNP